MKKSLAEKERGHQLRTPLTYATSNVIKMKKNLSCTYMTQAVTPVLSGACRESNIKIFFCVQSATCQKISADVVEK